MDLRLDETQEAVAATFSDLLARDCAIDVVRRSETTGFSEDLWRGFIELGAPLMGVPEPAGGLGFGLLELGLVALASGRALAPVPFTEVATGARLLCELEVDASVLTAVANGEVTISFCLDRPHAVPGTSRVRGGRRLVPFGAIANLVLATHGSQVLGFSRDSCSVAARAEDLASGAHAFWVLDPAGAAVRVLGTGDAAIRQYRTAESEWKLLTAFWLVGIARQAVEIGARYAQERIQFGRPIGSFQAIAHPLADCATRVDGAELLAMEAAWASVEEPQRFALLSAMAFAWASQTALRATGVSLHTHGGYGFSTEYDIQLYYRRACGLSMLAGGAREQLQSVGERCMQALGDASIAESGRGL